MPLTVLSVGFPLAKVSTRTPGGAEQILLTIDRGLVRNGYRSLVLAPIGSRCHGLLIPVPIPTGILDEDAKREARLSFRRALQQTLARYSVDVVHMHGLDFDQYLPKEDVPVIVTLHLPLSWYRADALRTSRPHTDLVCVSRNQRARAPHDVCIPAVIPNGVELKDFAVRGRKRNYAVVMGRICPEKATHVAIDAAELAGIKLLIAGAVFEYPEHRQYFEMMIRPRLGPRVQLVGAVGGNAKAQLLAGAKCLLIASQAPETSSLVAMEAMAAGTPVIAWRSGALPEIVTEGRTGFLVSSVEEMADRMRAVAMIRDESCRAEAQKRFDSELMISKYIGLYQTVAGRSVSPELQAA